MLKCDKASTNWLATKVTVTINCFHEKTSLLFAKQL